MSKQLSAEWQQKIESDMHEISKKFKTGTEYDVGYDHGFHYGYSLSAPNYVPQLVEAQERIKELEECIREFISLEESTVGYAMVTKQRIIHRMKEALSPVNPQKNSHDSRS